MTTKTINFEPFIAPMAANLLAKKEGDNLETDEEFKSIVALVFRDAVSQFMKDSKMYKVELPIDVYQDVKRYDIIPPDGYTVGRVVQLKENKINIPPECHDKKSITLTCCPNEDIDKAFYVEVSLEPKRINGPCEFDECFVEENYDAIETLMLSKMSEMTARSWKAKTSGEVLRRRYNKMVQKNIHDDTTGGSCIKVKKARLSDNASC